MTVATKPALAPTQAALGSSAIDLRSMEDIEAEFFGPDLAPLASDTFQHVASSGKVASTPPPASVEAVKLATLSTPLRGYGKRFEQALNRLTHGTFSSGNQVKLLFDGVQSFAARKALILGAKQSINLQTFIFKDDRTGNELADMLCRKAREGVHVRVLVDALGSSNTALFDRMRKAGVEVRQWAPIWDLVNLNHRLHEKYLVVDGVVSLQGGMNVADEYALGGTKKMVTSRGDKPERPWRDVDCLLSGPEVLDLQRRFLRNWVRVGDDVNPGEESRLYRKVSDSGEGVRAAFVSNHPMTDGTNHMEETYFLAITAAQKSIQIESAYFVPSTSVVEELIHAAQRGVKVSIMTNSDATNDIIGSSHVSRYFYARLLKAGIKIYEQKQVTLHSKTATFDGEFSITGSANLNFRSKKWDSEFVLCVNDKKCAKQYEQRFRDGLRGCQEVTLQTVLSWPTSQRLTQWFFSRFGSLY